MPYEDCIKCSKVAFLSEYDAGTTTAGRSSMYGKKISQHLCHCKKNEKKQRNDKRSALKHNSQDVFLLKLIQERWRRVARLEESV